MNAKELRYKIHESKEEERRLSEETTFNIAVEGEQVILLVKETTVEIQLRRYASPTDKWEDCSFSYMSDKMAIKLRDALITLFPIEKPKKEKK